jgi:23S rRNA pseudouridine1911/1915/1917 synthase
MTIEPTMLVVNAENAGSRLDAFIAQQCGSISRSKIQKLIVAGAVLHNGQPADKKTHCKTGDTIVIGNSQLLVPDTSLPKPQDIPLTIIYEDEYLLAVNKPAGLVVHPGNGNPDSTLVNALLYHSTLSQGSISNRPGIVHRLDKDTSGLLLVAKNDDVHAQLSNMFAKRDIEKYYVGMCSGMRPALHDIIDLPLARSKREPIKRSVQLGGKSASTEYWLVEYNSGISMLRFRLHTGRTHQIRVHCSNKGFPILCDELYGGGKEHMQTMAVLDRPFAYSVYKCFKRQALHAYMLRFAHPVTGASMELIAPLPEDFMAALSIMNIDASDARFNC